MKYEGLQEREKMKNKRVLGYTGMTSLVLELFFAFVPVNAATQYQVTGSVVVVSDTQNFTNGTVNLNNMSEGDFAAALSSGKYCGSYLNPEHSFYVDKEDYDSYALLGLGYDNPNGYWQANAALSGE